MTGQGALFINTAQGEIGANLLARRDDPVTSKRAAVRVARSHRVVTSLTQFLALIDTWGPLTCREAGNLMAFKPDYWRVEFAKRTDGWMVAGHIRCTGERDGSRVWRRI